MTMSNGNDETQLGSDATQVGGAPPAAATPRGPEDDDGDKRKWWLIVGGILLVGVLIGAGVALAGGGGDDETADGTSTSSSSSTSTTNAPTTTNAPATTKGTSPAPSTTTTTNVNDDPKIDAFSASPASHTCATSSDNWTLTLSWATTNTNQVVLSVDGPGAYATYNTSSGSQALTPGCPPAGNNVQHTYTITAKGPNGPDAVKTITYSINTVP